MRFAFKSGPDMRPTAISSPQYGDPVPLPKFSACALCWITTVISVTKFGLLCYKCIYRIKEKAVS